MNPTQRLLNLACGQTFHPDWTNVDICPAGAGVIQANLTQGIPFPDNSFDAVYHSHFIEHLRRPLARFLLKECFRVLVPGGHLRVATPDFERLARLYLATLENALQEDAKAAANYEWICIELFDQFSRDTTGGEMLEYWTRSPMPAEEFVFERMGFEAQNFVQKFRNDLTFAESATRGRNFRDNPVHHGELHRWLYDRYSLSNLLAGGGFTEIRLCSATESRLQGFRAYNLDTTEDGLVRKPDSLFMEATKPKMKDSREP
jgi:predicted SAM-dependent methyltransferase